MNKNFGLVLAGGGAKGAYELGAWEALRELGLEEHITAVAGTSVGALNALLFAQRDYEGAREVWKTIKQQDITDPSESTIGLENAVVERFPALKGLFDRINEKMLKIDTLELVPNRLGELVDYREAVCRNISELYSRVFSLKGVFSPNGLRDIIYKYTDMNKLKNGLPAYACAARLDCRELFVPYYFKLNNQRNKLDVAKRCLASSAIYPIFGRVDINGQMYVDGGIVDNVPLAPLYNIGYRRFIVICLSSRQTADTERYKDCEIIQVIPDSSMGDDVFTVINFARDALDGYIIKGREDTLHTLRNLNL